MTAVKHYRLQIDAGLEAFRSEIEFACDFIDECYGLERSPLASTILHYGNSSVPGAVHVPAVLFPDGVTVAVDGIRLERNRWPEIERGLRPAAEFAGDSSLSYDAIGLIFLMLSRIEERDSLSSDRHGRFPAAEAFSVRYGLHLEPPADCAARDVASLLVQSRNPLNCTRFRLRLTHDVDRLRAYHQPLDWIRPVVGDLVRRRDPYSALRRTMYAINGGEPWRSFRRLMAAEEAHTLRGHYYFMGPSLLPMDSPYAHTMAALLRRVIDEVRGRGHHIGFHPGYETSTDAAEWNRQREGLERIAGLSVREGRQHVLRYAAELTPDIWNDAGMEYDCTLAYPESTGFRTGSCRPFHAYSLRQRRKLALRQASSVICDFALLGGKYRQLERTQAMAECEAACEVCRRYGGELVVLFHTGLPDASWYNFYEELLSRLMRV